MTLRAWSVLTGHWFLWQFSFFDIPKSFCERGWLEVCASSRSRALFAPGCRTQSGEAAVRDGTEQALIKARRTSSA